ncbi:MAG: 2'-5' RNA ligase family protein [Planctomycetota bacterium]
MNFDPHDKLAMALVLLPDRVAEAHILAFNRALLAQTSDGPEIELGPGPHEARAHLTLAMGMCVAEDLEDLKAQLATLAAATPVLTLHRPRVENRPSQDTRGVCWLAFDPDNSVLKLHERALELLAPNAGRLPQDTKFFADDVVQAGARNYLASFGRISAAERFSPHITLGYGELRGATAALSITFGQLALAWVGPNCTMSSVISMTSLASRSP